MAGRYHFEAPRPSAGGQIGSALGTGLGAGLTRLAESKLDSMLTGQKQRKLTSEFVKMGIPEDQAAYLAKQDPETQWQAVRQWWMSQGFDSGDLPGSIHEQWETQPSPLDALSQAEQPTAAGQEQGPAAALQSLGQGQQAQQSNAMAALAPLAPQAPQAPQAPIPQMPKQRKARDLGEAFRIAEEATPKLKAEKEKKVPADVRKRADSAIDTADQMTGIAQEMIDLLNTGKVASGIKGGLAPIYLQSDESQQFEALSNELAGLLAGRSGVATNFKIKLAQSMKPNLRQSPNTQRKLAEKIIETSNDLRSKAHERLGEYGAVQPQRTSAQTAVTPKPAAGTFESLPNPAEYKGRKILDESTGQVLMSDGTSWKKG